MAWPSKSGKISGAAYGGGAPDVIAAAAAAPFHVPVAHAHAAECGYGTVCRLLAAHYAFRPVPACARRRETEDGRSGGRAEEAEHNKSNGASGEWVLYHV